MVIYIKIEVFSVKQKIELFNTNGLPNNLWLELIFKFKNNKNYQTTLTSPLKFLF
jgi:hypothetical protein